MKRFFRRKTSKQIAKDRLKILLISDRANCSPDMMDMIKTDINLCIDFVNAFSETEEDSLMLTNAQMKAIEAVLAYDYGRA